ncbi:MAG TPA: class I SAM-dependent methyltransferase [Candidatus Ozemobacteraceae bacterium]|nr:class I SAM-dependent methyltransferase [Candidatus Ozemobacteraceae bacterium]HQG28193.1 class I SAM-dependent methyltransferase [Candidatus Ozemobacteraceae bacterium]
MTNNNLSREAETSFHVIPEHLDRFLFEKASGLFAPDHEAVRANLYAGAAEVQRYLGTYFPRSFMEGRVLVARNLSHPAFDAAFRRKSPIRILDLGSGTGGFAAGLAWGLRERGITAPITIQAVDGNEKALEYQEAMWKTIHQGVAFRPVHCILPKRDWSLSLMDLEGDFDFVIASKFLVEMLPEPLNSTTGDFEMVPLEFLTLAEQLLRSPGLAIINELTMSVQIGASARPFLPELLNRAAYRHAGRQNSQLRIVLPVPCALFGRSCDSLDICFQQVAAEVVHSRKPGGDVSKSVPRVWATPDLSDKLLKGIGPSEPFTVASFRDRRNICIGGCLRRDKTFTIKTRNGFILSQG